MRIKATKVYPGPSIYAHCPIVYVKLENIEESSLALLASHSLQVLHELLPGLQSHLDDCQGTTFVPASAAAPGQFINHIFEHVCIELQRLADNQVACVRSSHGTSLSLYEAAIPYEEASVCKAAARLASDLLQNLLSSAPASQQQTDSFDFPARLDDFLTMAHRQMLPVQDRMLMRAARERGIPVMRLVGRTLILGQGRYQQRLSGTKTSLTNAVSNDIAANKDYSRRVLGNIGLPVPRYKRVYKSRQAVDAAKEIGFPVVVKPNNGKMGGGVSVGMKNSREVRAAYKRARAYGRSVLVEEVVQGADFRMMVINGKLCAAAKRVPGHIVGDGIQTIEELVDQINRDPRRGEGPRFSWTRLKIDDQAMRLLTELGYTLATIPARDEVVYLRRNANTSDGGTAVDVTDLVHPDNRLIAERAARAIGLDIAGVDFLTTDISKSMLEHGGAICEINSRPGLRKHMWPAEGKARDVASPIIDMLYPANTSSRIRLAAVTGWSAEKRAATARLLAQRMADEGRQVGLAVASCVYINGRSASAEHVQADAAARMILMDPDIDTAVIEVSPEDILEYGLAFDSCDVCVLVGNPDAALTHTDDLDRAIGVVTRCASEVIRIQSDAELDPIQVGRLLFDAGKPAAQ